MAVNTNNVSNAGLVMPDYKSSTTVKTASNDMGKDAFLKLLAAQARSQDPMSPTDNTQQIAQLAQFSSLEQMQNVAAELKLLRSSTATDNAIALVGREVTYIKADGTQATGTVGKVNMTTGGPLLTVGDAGEVKLDSVVEVR